LRILLIQPSQLIGKGRIYKAQKLMFPSLSLPVLASLTPQDFEVAIVDEALEDIPFEDPADLIGLSIMTPQAPRAYQIAEEFKRRGRKVVMGGIHASSLPEEALQYSDAVVVGEAEGIWLQVLEDFRRGRMKGIYRLSRFPDLANLPLPRFDLLKKDRYRLFNMNFPIQAGRGCPMQCDFCSATKVFGNQYRWRPTEDVIQNIQQFQVNKIFFVDDNIVGNRSYARDLFLALSPLRLRWAGQGCLNLGKDKEILKLAAESGCGLLYIGVESILTSNLQSYRKAPLSVGEILDCLAQFRKQRILIRASIIFGLENDDPGVFQRTVDFLIQEKAAYATFNILAPMPGTKVRERLQEEGRITDYDWSNYDGLHAVFTPRNMSKEELEKGLWSAYERFYSLPSIIRRILGMENRKEMIRIFFSNLFYMRIIAKRRHLLFGE